MAFLSRRAGIAALICILASGVLLAQDWKTATSLPGVDFSGLSVMQKASVLKILREQGCSCGCSMKMAQCRVEDPSCSYSTGLAATVIQAIKDGKTPDQAIQMASSSRFGANHENRLLEEPVKLAVAGSPVIGPADAPVTIVEFSDFQCPYCIQAIPEIEAMLKVYPKDVKLVFKQFPLEIHSDAYRAATAALAAQKQGKFWEMHYAMFAHHQNLSMDSILAMAKELQLDTARLQKDMESKEIHDIVAKDLQDGNDAGVEGTPTIFINGQRYNGRIQLSNLRQLVDAELKKGPLVGQTSRSARGLPAPQSLK
jgi:predicted DsbA family dithiol-disulfide isomerase